MNGNMATFADDTAVMAIGETIGKLNHKTTISCKQFRSLDQKNYE
jgi:hypothetical protein